MTFANMEAWLVVGALVLGGTVWNLTRPTPAKIKKDKRR